MSSDDGGCFGLPTLRPPTLRPPTSTPLANREDCLPRLRLESELFIALRTEFLLSRDPLLTTASLIHWTEPRRAADVGLSIVASAASSPGGGGTGAFDLNPARIVTKEPRVENLRAFDSKLDNT